MVEVSARGRHVQTSTRYLARFLTSGLDGKVTFSYKNYRKGGQKQSLTLDEWEFIRRFRQHIIPHRFVRIRLPCRFIVQGHYGILSNRSKQAALQATRKALGVAEPKQSEKQQSAQLEPDRLLCYCSCCGRSTPHLILAVLPPVRAGPGSITQATPQTTNLNR